MPMFTYAGRNLAEVEARSVVGRPRVADFELAFTFDFSMIDRADNPRIVYVDALVKLVAADRTLGETRPELTDLPSHLGNGNPVKLTLPLTGTQVRTLDRSRDAEGGLTLSANIRVLIYGPSGVNRHSQSIQMSVTDSDWRRLLQEMKFEERATFEVPIEGDRVGGVFAAAAQEFRGALDRRDRRDWTHVLTQCRRALDAMDVATPPNPPPRAQWNDHTPAGFRSWTLAQRVEFVRQALDLLAQPGPHIGIGEPGPKHAHYMTALTGLLLWFSATPESYFQ